MGALSILNAGAGDIRLTLDQKNPQELLLAKKMIQDMLRRGYVLFIEENGEYVRVTNFEETTGTYIVADYGQTPVEDVQTTQKTSRRGKKKIPMDQATAVAVARTAGG